MQPATRPLSPNRTVWAASVSMWRDNGSSVSSQCMSTGRPRSAASRTALDGAGAVFHRPLEVRNAANDADAHIERALERGDAIGRAVISVLREGDELQIDIGCDLFLDLEQRFGRHEARIDVSTWLRI